MSAEPVRSRGDASLLFQIKCALDQSSINMMIVDNALEITYINKGLKNLLREHRTLFQKSVKGFNEKRVAGMPLSAFLSDAPSALEMAQTTTTCHTLEVEVFGLPFVLRMNPVYDTIAKQIGVSIEWHELNKDEVPKADSCEVAEPKKTKKAQLKGAAIDLSELKLTVVALESLLSKAQPSKKNKNEGPSAGGERESLALRNFEDLAKQNRLLLLNAELQSQSLMTVELFQSIKLQAERLVQCASDAKVALDAIAFDGALNRNDPLIDSAAFTKLIKKLKKIVG